MDHPRDTCECGDYRYQHANSEGKCQMPNDLTHGFKPCFRFRLHREYEDTLADPIIREYEKDFL